MSNKAKKLLLSPADHTAKLITLDLVQKTSHAAADWADHPSENALHDFRVALRRLRTWLRTFPAYLSIRKKTSKKLKIIAKATNSPRDKEVAIAQLKNLSQKLKNEERPSCEYVITLLQQQQRAENSTMRRLAKTWSGIEGKVYEDIQKTETCSDVPFVTALTEALQLASRKLKYHLEKIASIDNEDDAHRARITAKHIRYLLEPFAKTSLEVKNLIERMKHLQNSLGQLRDSQLLSALLKTSAEDFALARIDRFFKEGLAVESIHKNLKDDLMPGMLLMAVHVKKGNELLFQNLQMNLLAKKIPDLIDNIASVCENLQKISNPSALTVVEQTKVVHH